MSIIFSYKTKKYFKIAIFLSFLLKSNFVFASIGYEENTNIMIDTMTSAFEMQAGDEILYYDFDAKEYRNGFVEFVDSQVAGLKIDVKEVETKKNRSFFIDYQ